jgi:GGDEF domain-containing protein/CHASE1-domain containing sensor protein
MRLLPAIAATVIGLALSVAAWLVVSDWEDRLAAHDFSTRANSHALILQNGIDEYIHDIAALRALFQSSEQGVGRQQFMTFSESLLRNRPAILATSWIPRIMADQREAHEVAAGREGLTGYRIHSAAADGSLSQSADASEYFPVLYSSKEPPGSPVYGRNLNDGGVRQEALERARDADQIAATSRFILRSGEGNDGFFVVMPVYRAGLPHDTVQDRRRNLGLVRGVFQIGVMIETILATRTTPAGLDLYFFAADSDRDASPLYFHSSRARKVATEPRPRAAIAAGLHWSGEIKVGDGRWTLVAAPIPGGPGTAGHLGPWMVLLGGLLISAVVVAYFWAATRHARRLQAANHRLDQTNGALDIANERLRAQNVRFDAALSNMSQALLMFDASGRLVVSNHRYNEMYRLSPDVVKFGCTIRELLKHRQENGTLSSDPDAYIETLRSLIAQGKICERIAELPDGRTIAVVNHPMADGGWVATHEDITERLRAEAKISHMAHHDALTNLPNRLLFHEQLEQALNRAKRGEHLAVLCLDVDHFKAVNDTLGHPIGDLLLRTAADRLRECIRDTDIVARLGGDEFAIVQNGACEPTEATALATRVIDAISAPYE